MRIGCLIFGLFLATLLDTAKAEYGLQIVAEDLDFPWSVAFLPDRNYLVAMRTGEVRRISTAGGTGPPLKGLPESYVLGQGGYFDIVVDPDFTNNQFIYLALAHGTPQLNGTRIVKGKLVGSSVENIQIIFDVMPQKDTPLHYGGKLLFLQDGTLMLTTGDGFEYREAAQDPFNLMGKIVRINRDGSIPSDNPFVNGQNGHPAVWSYGHRNPQGLAQDSATGKILMHEHGAKGGDELNLVKPGLNYGWPAVTRGVNYSGAYISPLRSALGIEDPLHFWVPSIAPSGLTIYRGEAFPQWDGRLLMGALVNKEVRKLTLQDGKIIEETVLFSELGERIRDVRSGPNGYVYLLTDSDKGKLIRVVPE